MVLHVLQCLTSEVLGSMRCDCREQLELSFDYIHEHGGVVIYMQQVNRMLT
jgi:GTP cyclohydrolase II